VNLGIYVDDVAFKSEGYELKGRIYKPIGDGKFPAVVICHGYPGDIKNMDLAEELAFNGVSVLVFYYQGAWGSEGTFRFSNLIASTEAAITFLRSQNYVDSVRLGLISYSMGLIPLTNIMSQDKTIKTGTLISPTSNLYKWLSEDILDNIFDVFLEMAKGKLTIENKNDYKQDMINVAHSLNPINKVVNIDAPMLFIVGSSDNETHPDDVKLLYEKAKQPKKLVVIDGADHSYSKHRVLLQDHVLGWLRDSL